ncbi:MAG TPA: hypothetical protein PLL36_09710, partial [Candidatus Hydrogenedentes bacterium]|nr:hypothetical protein [Candidatus Hydrogenedentota bacterium]
LAPATGHDKATGDSGNPFFQGEGFHSQTFPFYSGVKRCVFGAATTAHPAAKGTVRDQTGASGHPVSL